jgi:sugar transferase (PEP-CTERM system associated)
LVDPSGHKQNPVTLYPSAHEVGQGPKIDPQLGLVKQTARRGEKKTLARILLSAGERKWLLLSGDWLLILLSHYLSQLIRLGHLEAARYAGATVLTLLIYPAAIYIFDLYNTARPFHSRETLLRIALGIALGAIAAGLWFFFVPQWGYGRGVFAVQMVLCWMFLSGWREVYARCFQSAVARTPALILGAGAGGKALFDLMNAPYSPYDVKGILVDDGGDEDLMVDPAMVVGNVKNFSRLAKYLGIRTAIMALNGRHPSSSVHDILPVRFQGVEIISMATAYENLTGRIPVQHIEEQWLLLADGFYLVHKEQIQKLKRLLDFTVSSIMLLLTAPIMAVAAALIKIDSRGPVFYRQTRVGKRGWPFTIFKFRTMCIDAECDGAKWAEDEDPRATRVGRWLRVFHIDELPQLWNVCKGEMSLIGPRPERPEFVRHLERYVPYYFVRHAVPPGISGWAQIHYPYSASVEDAVHKLEYDLYYVKNMSLMLDLKILFKTIGVVFLREGSR